MGYTANRLIKIDGVDYDIGDVVPTAAVLPAYFKNLVRRGHISDQEAAAGQGPNWRRLVRRRSRDG